MKHQVKVRLYPLVQEAVENGVAYGIRRIFKHREERVIDEDQLLDASDAIFEAVMNDLCNLIEFDVEEGDEK